MVINTAMNFNILKYIYGDIYGDKHCYKFEHVHYLYACSRSIVITTAMNLPIIL